MTTAHSPAPWKVDIENIDGLVPILDARGERVATAEGQDGNGDRVNARLIVAAPDLLAACQQALKVVVDVTAGGNVP